MQNTYLRIQLNNVLVEGFFRTHRYLVEHLDGEIPRLLMQQINWDNPLIAIKGTRGVGKTTFLLQYAKKYFSLDSQECLYVNLNHFYFTNRTIVDFAQDFMAQGGKVLLLDQIFKYQNWEDELKYIAENFPSLKIVFTVSTVMKFWGEENILGSLVHVYNLRGFSYREFLNILLEEDFRAYSLAEILKNHREIASAICKRVDPLKLLWDYQHHGYYPFFLEKKNFSENLLKTINMMLEVDVLSIRQIEHTYLPKLRKLLYLLAIETPCKPNISQLSVSCEISRATVTNYLEYLRSARLINMLYKEDESFPKKPEMVYLHNTNLIFPMQMTSVVDNQILSETFFYNQIHHSDASLKKGVKKATFVVNKNNLKYKFKIEPYKSRISKKADCIHVMDGIKEGSDGVIPLWLFGFLY